MEVGGERAREARRAVLTEAKLHQIHTHPSMAATVALPSVLGRVASPPNLSQTPRRQMVVERQRSRTTTSSSVHKKLPHKTTTKRYYHITTNESHETSARTKNKLSRPRPSKAPLLKVPLPPPLSSSHPKLPNIQRICEAVRDQIRRNDIPRPHQGEAHPVAARERAGQKLRGERKDGRPGRLWRRFIEVRVVGFLRLEEGGGGGRAVEGRGGADGGRVGGLALRVGVRR